ncbi:hypothetical protein AC578_5497 [Pseudocercospora eumusae]|uniref:SnoaL-like domain-containing protein n=1 Tax=Pseudocercospora eumusae TaxID=321146 RepID=A0A139GUL9_9PEZI|nr:hypothetical protein AC578_5497 [Pseudocercospora eumusae]
MRPFAPQLTRSLQTVELNTARANPISSFRVSPSKLTVSPNTPQKSTMSTDKGELKIENTNIKTREGVTLTDNQKTLVGSVLDLFAGRPSLAKLQLWKDDATFEDPITVAKGRRQYEPQWYGLQAAFSEIERLNHEVTSSGNPIEMDLKTRYVVKGIGKEQVVESKVLIYTEGEKISMVQDKWDGKLPDSGIANVSFWNPFSWIKYAEGWAWWTWSWVWYTTPWMAFRRLNANSVPLMVSVPKNAEEDAKRGNQ